MIYQRSSTRVIRDLGLIVALLVFALAVPYGSAQNENSSVSIGNFGKVNENYYRGSQPGEAEITQLKKLGIKTIVDLRRDKKPQEVDWASRAGMQYYNIPLRASRAATEEQTEYFMSLVNDPANWPVYVHCKAGRHRTGALTAVYRMTHDGWTADQAFSEMKHYKFGMDFLHPEFKSFVYAYDGQLHHAAAPSRVVAAMH